MSARRIPFLNCHFDNLSFDEVVEVIRDHVRSRKPGFMVSLNTDIAVRLKNDPTFVEAYNAADLALMDSQPLIWLARLSGIDVRERLTGSDLLPRLCEVAAREGWSCYIAGGKPGIPEQAARNLKEKYEGLRIAGTLSPRYGFELDPHGIADVASTIRNAQPDILFFCLGTPKTEKILYPHLEEFGASFTLSVGAAVDFAAGSVHRAPRVVQLLGLEWLFRFLQEPTRLFRRYFIDSWQLLDIYRRYRREMSHAHRN